MIFKPESKIKELKKSRKDIDAENIKHDIDIYEFKKLKPNEIKKLNSEQLNEYLRRKLKDTKNINKHVNTITVNQEVGGSNFLDLTRDDLLSIKIPLRPIKDIEKVINKIKREQSDTSDISNLKSSIEYIKDKLKDIYELIARY
ncbi:hypothetical protein GLOIN_2v1776063 [Rhizophagus irregularis DAOM 181602=DAOM 197198]|uniref:SAM domain-containing protein n=1 Tax=Rhizophagus irregularis (strain DAOM 181602 / DAOM 197198 / MUCL 43194) TaxID=747089 RepID=A0A2P4PY68_RHIID|nr:hypothetical protein GLOIN_2v1776063 [Rhizophagus irregularis DAOM 181602=DAOM 197198]POG70310.1 hypothetical protein GLOIN_2v1776063 [Rhizophagus irregularis DAOM 181602=DAOM 197198]|eukprot:XP_025177176.1 hypothetical protein GLOIN_2v1776063 [Rhizophagus irregularis DAOM 181602=DAOM 197198]